jgi:hypothetical protein
VMHRRRSVAKDVEPMCLLAALYPQAIHKRVQHAPAEAIGVERPARRISPAELAKMKSSSLLKGDWDRSCFSAASKGAGSSKRRRLVFVFRVGLS